MIRLSSSPSGRRQPYARRRAPVAPALLGTLLLTACGGGDRTPLQPTFDLVAAFPEAELGVQTQVIDFGTPEARTFLTSGWSPDREDERRQETYVRSTAWSSAIRFNIVAPENLRLRFTCWPLRAVAPEGVELTLTLNGEVLTSMEVEPKFKRYKLQLPAERLVRGANQLELGYRQLATGRKSRQRPVLHWYRLELGNSETQAPPPRAEPESDLLFLPYGTELSYLAWLPEDSRLRAEHLRLLGEGAGRLEIHVETDEEGASEVARLDGASGFPEIRLNPGGPQAARLTLRALADGRPGPEAGVALKAPRIWSAGASASGRVEAVGPSLPEGRRPNIIVYLIDTLRADHLGCYGYPRPVSPRIDEFAAGATLFENAVGQSSWTRASVASVFTGLWPAAHGAVGRRDRLPPDAVTLAEALSEAGYATGAVITNFNVHRSFGFDQGFDEYIQTSKVKTGSEIVNAHALTWLERRDPDKPFFLYLHTVDPHNPYLPPERFRERFAPGSDELVAEIERRSRNETWEPTEETIDGLKNLYDALIAYNDESFGALTDELRRLDLWDDSLVVLLSDHGEEFHEHGRWMHGKDLHVETLNFPLIVKAPGQRGGRRRAEIVQHVDIMPTLLAAVGIDVSAVVQGRSFLPLLEEAGTPTSHVDEIYSHLHLDGPLQLSLVTPDWKLIQRREGGQVDYNLLYRWPEDRRETENLAFERPVTTAVLTERLASKLRQPGVTLRGGEVELDPEVEKQLRALGYLQ